MCVCVWQIHYVFLHSSHENIWRGNAMALWGLWAQDTKIPSCNRSGNHCFKWISLKAPDYALSFHSGWCLFNSLSNISPFILLGWNNGNEEKIKDYDPPGRSIERRSISAKESALVKLHLEQQRIEKEKRRWRYRPHNKGGGPVVNPLDPLGPGSVLSEDGRGGGRAGGGAGGGENNQSTRRMNSTTSRSVFLPYRECCQLEQGRGQWRCWALDYPVLVIMASVEEDLAGQQCWKSWNFQAHYDLFAFTTQVQPFVCTPTLPKLLPGASMRQSWQIFCAAALILICFMCTCCFCLRHHCLPGVRLCPYLFGPQLGSWITLLLWV